jgi:putative membrane protein
MRLRVALLASVLAVLVWSGIGPHDRLTWWLEVAPVLIALPLIAATHARFPLSALASVLIALHAVVLCVGGHWTYARVPAGAWVQEWLGWQRNPYDRLGHLAQGFVPAIVAREVLLRTSPLRPGAWLAVLGTAVVLAISALYELVEWWAALLADGGAVEFLGTQGDVWDTQWDMFLALCGAVVALATVGRAHDRSLRRLREGATAPGSHR